MFSVRIKKRLEGLPPDPGVYLMKEASGDYIYIGKAKSLSDRVRSYFQEGAGLTPRIRSMIGNVDDIEFIVTGSELEALILENNLIKKHKPRYNVILRDDKNYPFLRLPVKDDFPRLEVVRRVARDSALYFGPYVPANALRETLRVIRRVFPLATCKIKIDGKAPAPCMQFQIKRCMAPCTGNQTKEEYHGIVRQVKMFLEGKDRELINSMKAEMEAASDRLDFEGAERIRDKIFKIEKVLERQRITSTTLEDQDVMAFSRDGEYCDVQVMFIRGGMLIGRKDFFLEGVGDATDQEILYSIFQQLYSNEIIIPGEILIPVDIQEREIVEGWLSEQKGKRVRILTPERGKDAGLIKLAKENAEIALKEKLRERADGMEILAELKLVLGLKRFPHRIEAFDISNTMGSEAVGSLVVWEDNRIKKSAFRKFRIKTVYGADDFAMMGEVITRRFSKLDAGEETKNKGWEAPDLVIIDGGKGQLSSALGVLKRIGLDDIDIIALAKAKGEKEDRVFLPGEEEARMLDQRSAVTHLLQRIRDESHRFAIDYHKNLRGKDMISSPLDSIRGVGKKTRASLLQHFKGLTGIKDATLEELEETPGIKKKVAEEIYKRFRR